jgi:hypothetical protein
MVYLYVISLDNDILNDYNNTCTILSYDNDLELYLEIIDALIKIYEEKEEYEKCSLLIQKKEDATIIIENKTTTNVNTVNIPAIPLSSSTS